MGQNSFHLSISLYFSGALLGRASKLLNTQTQSYEHQPSSSHDIFPTLQLTAVGVRTLVKRKHDLNGNGAAQSSNFFV